MKKIIECVPNFSEGRDKAKIDEIVKAIEQGGDVRVLDVDPGEATNRTVVTFVGEPEAVCDAAIAGMRKAAELIDMRTHHGAHPRIPCPSHEAAAFTPERKNLAVCREGEYEGLPERLGHEGKGPDFGDRPFDEGVASTGCTAVGARDFLIAVNFNLNTTSTQARGRQADRQAA